MRRRLVVVVDDEPMVLYTALRLLEAGGYRVIGYSSAEAALEDQAWRGAAVAVIDVQLPGMDGVALASAMRAIDDGLRVVFASGDVEGLHGPTIPKNRFAELLVDMVGDMLGNGAAT